MTKPLDHQRAEQLRLKGISIRAISKLLGVSKSTVSNWVRGIDLTDEQKLKLGQSRQQAALLGAKKATNLFRGKVLREADSEWLLLKINPTFIFGLALYIGEGSKGPWSPGITNCNPRVLRSVLNFYKLIGVDSTRLRVSLQVHHASQIESSQLFWSRELSIPLNQFNKTFIRKSKPTTRRHTNQKYGTCHIRFHNVAIMLRITRWIQLALDGALDSIPG
jgi:transcriptional regulator with XRE-family HTH domain